MGEAQDRRKQNGTSMVAFFNKHGFSPATVVAHERKSNGMTLITSDPDPDLNIEIYDDDRTPHRTGETPEWAEDE